MKKSMFKIFSLFVFSLGLISCEKEFLKPILTATTGPNITLSKAAIVLVKEQIAAEAVTVSWPKPDYGFNAAATYTLLIDKKGGDFSKFASLVAKVSRSQTIAFTGNVIVAFPVSYCVSAFYFYLTGNHIMDPDKSIHSVHDQNPFISLALLHASIAGFYLFLSGIIAGVFASFSITPVEQLTIDKQLGVKKYNLKHLYQGWRPTVFRESLGFGIHFTAYEYLSNKFNSERDFIKTIFFGAGATITGWSFITPLDRIKTKIQSGNFDHKTYDYRGSFKGFRFALMRAVPFHVICFLIMEFLTKNSKDI